MKYSIQYYRSLILPADWKWFGFSSGKHIFRKEISKDRFKVVSVLEQNIEDGSFIKKLKN